MIIWQFSHIMQTVLVMAKWINSSGDGQVNYRRLHDQQLTLGQFVLPMQTWKWNAFKMLQMSTMRLSHHIKIKAMQVCSSRFYRRWRYGVPSTGRIPFASCHQLNMKSLWGNHNLCHICQGYCNVTQSFDRVKSWKIGISFSAVKQLVHQTPFWEKIAIQFFQKWGGLHWVEQWHPLQHASVSLPAQSTLKGFSK